MWTRLTGEHTKVNLLALEGVVRLGPSLGNKLEAVVNTLVPAVCKNLASSNQQVGRMMKACLICTYVFTDTIMGFCPVRLSTQVCEGDNRGCKSLKVGWKGTRVNFECRHHLESNWRSSAGFFDCC